MSSKFDPFKNSPPIPHNFGQVPPTPNSSSVNLTRILILGGIIVAIAATVAFKMGKSAASKEKEE
jgi:hypothetical protein